MKNWIVPRLLLFVALAGCAAWQPSGGSLRTDTYAVEMPAGWMRLEPGPYVMISRDGPFLQYMLLQERSVDRPFQHTRKALRPEMLPQEAAQVIIDDMRSDPAVSNLEIIENAPAVVDGHDGFRLVFSHRTPEGLAMLTAYYGLIHDRTYHSMRFSAAQRHYFDKDIQTFENLVANFRLVSVP
jgi:hypothetical protein